MRWHNKFKILSYNNSIFLLIFCLLRKLLGNRLEVKTWVTICDLLQPVEEVNKSRDAPYLYLAADVSLNSLKDSKLQLPEYLKGKMYWHQSSNLQQF